jgi:hypothetical protein
MIDSGVFLDIGVMMTRETALLVILMSFIGLIISAVALRWWVGRGR